MIVIVFGLPGSGKSYFAIRVAQILNAKYISSDCVRKEMFAKTAYSYKNKALVYNEMLRRTIESAEHGKEVVLDATFYLNELRQKFIDDAQELTNVFWIEVIADETLIKERLTKSRGDSDANFEVYQMLKSKWQPFNNKHLVLKSTNNNILNMMERTADYLFQQNDKAKH